MHIHVQPGGHLHACRGSHACPELGLGAGLRILRKLCQLFSDLAVEIDLMVKGIRHGGVDLGGRERRVLATHFLGRPSMCQVIHCDLRDADAGQTTKASGFANRGVDVRIGQVDIDCSTPAFTRFCLATFEAWHLTLSAHRSRKPSGTIGTRRRGFVRPCGSVLPSALHPGSGRPATGPGRRRCLSGICGFAVSGS